MTVPEYTGENRAPRNSRLMQCPQGLVQPPTELDKNSDLPLTRRVNLQQVTSTSLNLSFFILDIIVIIIIIII